MEIFFQIFSPKNARLLGNFMVFKESHFYHQKEKNVATDQSYLESPSAHKTRYLFFMAYTQIQWQPSWKYHNMWHTWTIFCFNSKQISLKVLPDTAQAAQPLVRSCALPPKAIHPHTLTSLGGRVTIFSNKTTFKMAAELVIQFSDHVRYKDVSYQRTWSITGLC